MSQILVCKWSFNDTICITKAKPSGFCGKHEPRGLLLEQAAKDGRRVCDDGKRSCKNYTEDFKLKCEVCLQKNKIYSAAQVDVLSLQLITSTPSGIINIFNKYYLSRATNANHRSILRLLLQISVYTKDLLLQLQTLLESEQYVEVENTLQAYIASNPPITNDNLERITDRYLSFEDDDARYMWLHTLYDAKPDEIEAML